MSHEPVTTLTCRRSGHDRAPDGEPLDVWTLLDIEEFCREVRAHGGMDDLVIPGALSVRLAAE